MDSLFSFIPQNIDKNLRLLLIFLISLQFTAFLLYIFFTIKDYLKVRKERNEKGFIETPKSNLQGEDEDKSKINKIE